MRLTRLTLALLSCCYSSAAYSLVKHWHSCENADFPEPPCCGIAPEHKVTSRVQFGDKTEKNEFPWLVYLYVGSKFCSGTVINTRWILTAAHCVKPHIDIVAYFGADLCHWGFCEKMFEKIKIKKAIKHEKWRMDFANNNYDDIALLMLVKPISYSNAIQPICLPTTSATSKLNLNEKIAIAAGWGFYRDKIPTPNLMKTSIEIWPDDACDSFNGWGVGDLNSKYQICAGGERNAVCGGDSGGPLFLLFENDTNYNYYQYGTISYGARDCGRAGFPQVFARVTYYMDWIRNTILKNKI